MSSDRTAVFSTRLPFLRRTRRKKGTLLFSLAVSVAAHAAGAAFFLTHPASAPQVHLLLRSGEEAVQLEIGQPATMTPRPSAREIPEPATELRQNRASVFEKDILLADLPRTERGFFHSHYESARYRLDIAAEPARAEKPVPARRRKTEDAPSNRPDAASPRQRASAGAPAMAEGAPSRPRGVRQRPLPQGTLLPHYPDSSRRLGEEGEVLVRAVIDASGHCTTAGIEQSSGHRALDQAALDTVLRATYRPATEDGMATAAEERFIIEFQLR